MTTARQQATLGAVFYKFFLQKYFFTKNFATYQEPAHTSSTEDCAHGKTTIYDT